MCSRCNRNHLLSYINIKRQALFIDRRKLFFNLSRFLKCYIQKHMIISPLFHFSVYSSSNYITRSKRTSFVIFMHKLLTIYSFQDTTKTTHSFSYQKRRSCPRMIKSSWVKLHKLHTLYFPLSAGNHCNSITSSNIRVCSCLIYRTNPSSCHQCNFRQKSIYLISPLIQNICTITFNSRSMPCYNFPKMMLCEYLYSKMIFKKINIRMLSNCIN